MNFHFGTESIPVARFSDAPPGPFAPIARQPKQHAYETLEGDSYYANRCKFCESAKGEHNGIFAIVEYLKATVTAYRNPQCPFAAAAMVRWGKRLEARELAIAFQVLEFTGTEVWRTL